MSFMFRNCDSLTSLDLSNFNIALIKDMIYMIYMFDYCTNLHYLNLKNFEQNYNLDYTVIFKGILNNTIIFINK